MSVNGTAIPKWSNKKIKTMTTQTLSLEQLAEKIGGKLWTKGDLKRIYLDRGYNTKKMSTKTYVYQKEDGSFGVSCYIDCPSQPYQWIKSQQDEIIEGVQEDIDNALSETVYIMANEAGKIVNWEGKEAPLNHCECHLTEKRAKREVDNCVSYHSYVTMPRADFDAEVEKLINATAEVND